jgi:hypothetical protein
MEFGWAGGVSQNGRELETDERMRSTITEIVEYPVEEEAGGRNSLHFTMK